MTTIAVPAWLPAEPELKVTEASSAILTDVRAAATAVSDVADWARANGAPADFSGDAAEAARSAVTTFAADTDAVSAALERGALAIDEFLTAMRQRRTEHDELMERRQTLNSEREDLLRRIEGATEEQVPGLQADAAQLRSRFAAYQRDLETWRDRVDADEQACVRALAAVDQLAEGAAAAKAPGRADTDALKAELTRLGTDTDAVFAWWNGLSEAERNALMISDPDLVGNTNGIPTGDRDEANTSAVQRDIEYLLGKQASGEELSASEQRWLDNAQSIEQAVANAQSPQYADLGVDAFVMAYQPHAFGGDGIAAVAYGDPDTADHTAVYVPGIMQDGTQIDENGMQALNLYEETVNSMAGEDPPRTGSVSTIAWIGYDSPNFNPESKMPWDLVDSAGDVSHTVTEANAQAGGIALSQFVDGLNSTHTGGDQPHLTVIGHSYGSTTSSYAAAGGMDADSLVLIGSPGASEGVHHASDLNMPAGQVFVGAADNDPVSWLGGEDGLLPGTWDDSLGLGADPAQHDFGATVFAVDNGEEFHGAGLVTTGFMENHTNYFDDGNPALASMADVVSGNSDAVVDTGGRTQEAHDYLYDWVGGEVQHHVVQPVVDTYTDVRDGVVQTYEDVRDGVVETYEGVRDGVDDAIDRTGDAFEDAWDTVWPPRWP
ncbi:alpha/beta hydrolase [Nocardioides KLBMP 9356]|uniref:Alpha/beta hydrolase n=1 Tax=Nocardioides potassii TaxID=2911371 RepID=A0ABS9HG23_9ACTN|nr:alpha/beta hydrolase [Nocardioides potassii]MCF6379189.1 alpha/beta hydrolase [Nocardioides potassii]